jgi:hypothetical protein
VISEPDPRIAAHARELGVTYAEAAELAEHIARGVTDANEERLHDELRHAGAIPDNVRHLPRTEQIRHAVSTHRATRARDVGLADLDTFLNEPDPEYDWLIPDLLERGDRCVITGEEGQGKSTLLRQMSIQVAAGIHPFTLEEIAPKRTLLIDVENPRRLVRRKLRPMRLSAGGRLLPGYMIPVVWSEGLDLRTDEDYERLSRLIDDVGADLVLTGPSYKLASGDPTAEETAKAVSGPRRPTCATRLRDHPRGAPAVRGDRRRQTCPPTVRRVALVTVARVRVAPIGERHPRTLARRS